MNPQHDDYLWDPNAAPDVDIENLERALKPLGAGALNLGQREILLPVRSPVRSTPRRLAVMAAAAAFALIVLYALHVYRLSWSESAPWTMRMTSADGMKQTKLLQVGSSIATTSGETAMLDVARIGEVKLEPNSEARLVLTNSNRHRLELERGHLHAKIWAPPNYFGVSHGDASFIDMGCEFDLQIDSPAAGSLTVKSGWVFYSIGYEEVLVPEHYLLTFVSEKAQIPVRLDSSIEFRRWVNELDARSDSGEASDLAIKIADTARDEDFYTLHTLLRRHPQLARSPLYPRLAAALKAEPSEIHRARWARGETEAINEWLHLWPKHPKQWWVNWRDVF